jgi:glycosyltransferase involved in cell wall biosynthesis
MDKTQAGRPAISVIVMAYKSEAVIEAAVKSVLEQNSDEPFEVIVVSSGVDKSAEVVGERFPDVGVIHSKERLLPGAARNAGIAKARGEFFAFLEAHGRAEPGWISARLGAHRAGHPVVAGVVGYGSRRSLIGLASHYYLYCNRLPGRPPGVVSYPDSGAHSLSFARATFDKVGPFDETVRVAEDTRVAKKLTDMRISIWLEPRVVTAHPRPTNLPAMLADLFRRGRRASRAAGLLWTEPSLPGVLVLSLIAWMQRLRWTFVRVRTYGAESPLRLALLSPFLVAGSTAARLGWVLEQIRMRREGRNRSAELPSS